MGESGSSPQPLGSIVLQGLMEMRSDGTLVLFTSQKYLIILELHHFFVKPPNWGLIDTRTGLYNIRLSLNIIPTKGSCDSIFREWISLEDVICSEMDRFVFSIEVNSLVWQSMPVVLSTATPTITIPMSVPLIQAERTPRDSSMDFDEEIEDDTRMRIYKMKRMEYLLSAGEQLIGQVSRLREENSQLQSKLEQEQFQLLGLPVSPFKTQQNLDYVEKTVDLDDARKSVARARSLFADWFYVTHPIS